LAAFRAFSGLLLQDLLVQRQVGHDPLQPRILILEHLQPPQLGHAEVRILLLPCVVPGFRHADLPASSTTGVTESANRSAYAICSSLNLDFFIASLSVPCRTTEKPPCL